MRVSLVRHLCSTGIRCSPYHCNFKEKKKDEVLSSKTIKQHEDESPSVCVSTTSSPCPPPSIPLHYPGPHS